MAIEARPGEQGAPPLVERDDVLHAAGDLVASLSRGRGGALVVEGAAGLGKTSVLHAARARGVTAGVDVVHALGGELEQDLPWGVARELLARPARARPRLAPATVAALGLGTTAPTDDLTAVHALTALVEELAEATPLLLVVDDAHWADRPSAAWLAYLAPRLAQLPAALLLAARPNDPRRPPELATLAGRDGVRTVALAPLTEQGADAVIARALPEADDATRSACRRATGGNPFLLTALLEELARSDGPATVDDAAPDRVERAVARRLAAAGPEAEALARAVAVLGAHADPATAAALAGLEPEAASRAGDALRAAGLLADAGGEVAFVHPLLRAAVSRAMPAGQRSLAHAAAARLLDEAGGPASRVGAHLLVVEPGSDPWVRERLLEAADAAAAAAAPRHAVALLERALAERAGRPGPDLLARLGRAALVVEPELAAGYLRRALELTRAHEERVALVLDLSVALQGCSRWSEAVTTLEQTADDLAAQDAPRELWLRVQTELLAQAYFDEEHRDRWPRWLARAAAEVHGHEEAGLGILLQQGVERSMHGTAAEARDLARRAWAGGRLVSLDRRESPAVWWVTYVAMYAGDHRLADEAIEREMADARRLGSVTATAYASTQLAELRHRQGRLRESEALGDAAWNVCTELGPGFWCWWITLPARVQTRLARGRPREAWTLLEEVGLQDGELPPVISLPLLRAVRASARIACGDAERGVEELRAAGSWVLERTPSPGGWLWPADLVDGLLALGRPDEALEEAEAWLAQTERFGAPLTVGLAQRAVGLALGGTEGIEWLERAVETLRTSGAQAEQARALVDLGAALRRANRRAQAREPLRLGADLALRAGADGAAERAAAELAATGSRPRSLVLDGVASLTPSELRVAQMAAAGNSNPEIAATLFVTRKTVEKHLGNVFLKLGIRSRDALPQALSKAE